MNIVFRPARPEDAEDLAPRLRRSDRDELAALSNRSPAVSLRLSIEVSDSPMAIVENDIPIALFGVGRSSIISETGSPWLLGSKEIEHWAKTLLPRSRAIVAAWRQQYPVLVNHVSAGHRRSIRWLKWLGFTLYPAAPHGPFGHPFRKFEMRSDNV